ncbi:hypothetical protein M514_09552 [Trichuris suis]|uniref:Uncharacterized protein n=1 Tax=Trichuris suis TaxID=68888 RepID=A0A085NL27_9BILA|nr:hypothetical protein M513_09552 [Trichuris suis]KFD70173.1 hypothetical protein M514_09552 [Trichuris suis]
MPGGHEIGKIRPNRSSKVPENSIVMKRSSTYHLDKSITEDENSPRDALLKLPNCIVQLVEHNAEVLQSLPEHDVGASSDRRDLSLLQDDSTLKPDLVLPKGTKSWILDVAIPWESNESLDRTPAEKCRKRASLIMAVGRLTGATEFVSGMIVIGTRGAWCALNDNMLSKMDFISDKTKELLCVMTLERTCQIISWFMCSTDSLALRQPSVRTSESNRHARGVPKRALHDHGKLYDQGPPRGRPSPSFMWQSSKTLH